MKYTYICTIRGTYILAMVHTKKVVLYCNFGECTGTQIDVLLTPSSQYGCTVEHG